ARARTRPGSGWSRPPARTSNCWTGRSSPSRANSSRAGRTHATNERRPKMPERPWRYGAQAVLYALFAIFIGYFSTSPTYRHLEDDQALLRISFRHPGKLAADCRTRTAEELAKLPVHLRAEQDCDR